NIRRAHRATTAIRTLWLLWLDKARGDLYRSQCIQCVAGGGLALQRADGITGTQYDIPDEFIVLVRDDRPGHRGDTGYIRRGHRRSRRIRRRLCPVQDLLDTETGYGHTRIPDTARD